MTHSLYNNKKDFLHFLPYLLLPLLLLGIGWFYAPTLRFGFIWDDPQWFGRVIEKSWAQLVQPTPDFQFYRPGTMLYNRLFLRSDGTFAVTALHTAQVSWHLLNTALFYAISRRLGLTRYAAAIAAALFATYPFSYQAVAWAAPQQPLVSVLQNGAWLTYLYAQPEDKAINPFWPLLGVSFVLFVIALTIQESSIPLALVPLLFAWLQQKGNSLSASIGNILKGNGRFALIYPLLAAIYGLLWLRVPRQGGITGLVWSRDVASYLLQGFVYPLVGRTQGYDPQQLMSANNLLLIGILTLIALITAASWQRQGRLALVGCAWASLGIAPSLVGLPFSYVSLGSRLLYYAAPGVAWLWIAALTHPDNPLSSADTNTRTMRRLVGFFLLGAMIIHSVQMLCTLQRLYEPGIAHLQEMLAQMQGENGRFIFVNFPDRYQSRDTPYPLGYWGVTLAPVIVALGDFPAMLTGNQPQTTSYSLPWIDTEVRESGPYQVDMRGVILDAEALYAAAADQNNIYLSRYLPNGRFSLQQAGAREIGIAPDCPLVLFDNALCLHAVQVHKTDLTWEVTLIWSALTTVSPHLTIFTHLGQPDQPPIAQADGDAWRTMLPAAVWQPGDLIYDQRSLPRVSGDTSLSLQIGVYDWVTGERAGAILVDGKRPLPDNAFIYPLQP